VTVSRRKEGSAPDRGAGSAAHASLFSSRTCFVSHSTGACFAGLLTGLGLHAAANGWKQEMLERC
jgi:hypothetical protein